MENADISTRTVKIGGRTFDLAFTVASMIDIRKLDPDFDFGKVDEIVSTPEGMVHALYVLAKSGAMLKNETLDVDEDWFSVHIPANVRKFVSIQIAIMETMADAMMMEAEEDDERSHEVDVVLQEIQKKREKTDSPGESSSATD